MNPRARVEGVNLQEDNVLSYVAETVRGTTVPKSRMTETPALPTSEEQLDLVLASLEDDKAENIVSIDLRGKSEMADHMVICSGRSSRQVGSIAEKLTDRVKQAFGWSSKVEGKESGDWVLIDAGDIIVHVFRPEVRDFYQLEKMWMTPAEAAEALKG